MSVQMSLKQVHFKIESNYKVTSTVSEGSRRDVHAKFLELINYDLCFDIQMRLNFRLHQTVERFTIFTTIHHVSYYEINYPNIMNNAFMLLEYY